MDTNSPSQGAESLIKKITKKKSTSLIAILVVILVVVIVLIGLGVIKAPIGPISTILQQQKKPMVELKTEYNNPFAKETQYVNPFDKYKNPFVVNR